MLRFSPQEWLVGFLSSHFFQEWGAFLVSCAGFMFLFTWLVIKLNKIEDKKNKPDYSHWDHVDPLKESVAACLWAEVRPYHHGKIEGGPEYGTHNMIKSAISNGKIKVASHDKSGINMNTMVSRKALKLYAILIGQKPKFLFPEER